MPHQAQANFDALCVNLVIKYIPFKYAKLRDILSYFEKGGCGTSLTSDFESGYHALLLHPYLAEFCGVR